MDRPPGGWSEVVTNQTLDLKIDALRHELRADLEALSGTVDRRLRAQTWITTTTLIAIVAATGSETALLHPDDEMLWDAVYLDRKPDRAVRDGDELEVAGERLRIVHTPG